MCVCKAGQILDRLMCRRREMEQQVQQVAGGLAVIKETLYGGVSGSGRPASPSPRHPSHSPSAAPTCSGDAAPALLASHGTYTH